MAIESQSTNRKRILIFEDDLSLQAMLVQALQAMDYEVFHESEGSHGLERTLELRPDLILLDINLPGLKGTEICRQIKADARIKQCIIFMMTGEFKSMEDKLKGFAIGVDDYIFKPFDLKILLARIKSILK